MCDFMAMKLCIKFYLGKTKPGFAGENLVAVVFVRARKAYGEM